MNTADVLLDPEMGAAGFSILRKTWTRESGVPVLVDLEEVFTWGTVHPADPAVLELLPEESRHDPVVLVHSTEPLSLGEADGEYWTSPDEILWEGRSYRVFKVRSWQAFGFWKGWAVQL